MEYNFFTSVYITFCITLGMLFLIKRFLGLLLGGDGGGKQLPPCPPGIPMIGNLVGMLMNRPTTKWIVRVMNDMKTDIACFRFGRVHVIAITSDEIAREVVKEKDSVFADRPDSYSAEYISCG